MQSLRLQISTRSEPWGVIGPLLLLACAFAACGAADLEPTPPHPTQAGATRVGAAPSGAAAPSNAARAAGTAEPEPLVAKGAITIAGRESAPSLSVELARTAAERARGLMFRRSLAPHAGMLFFMGADGDWSFWMRNTYLSLDMIFVDADWVVVGILAAVPPLNDQSRAIGKTSRYVLELAAHEAAVHGIVPGTRLVFAAARAADPRAQGAGR